MISTLAKGVNSFNIGFFNEDVARKNMCKTKLYVVGYARLYYDEDGLGYVSIVNQREILDDVYDKEFKTADSEYVFIEDDNISGYKFDRPGTVRSGIRLSKPENKNEVLIPAQYKSRIKKKVNK